MIESQQCSVGVSFDLAVEALVAANMLRFCFSFRFLGMGYNYFMRPPCKSFIVLLLSFFSGDSRWLESISSARTLFLDGVKTLIVSSQMQNY